MATKVGFIDYSASIDILKTKTHQVCGYIFWRTMQKLMFVMFQNLKLRENSLDMVLWVMGVQGSLFPHNTAAALLYIFLRQLFKETGFSVSALSLFNVTFS